MAKSFIKGDVVRYAEGWYTEAEKDILSVVVEAFDDVQKAKVFTPSAVSAFGGYYSVVFYEMIDNGSFEDAERLARFMHEHGIR